MSRALVAFVVFAACSTGPRPVLTTTAETSRYIQTGRYDEALRLCHDFARAYAGVECVELGRTGEDRPVVAVHVRRGAGRPAIYIQAGIHAGEIEGKDAGFWFLRDLLDGKVAPGALDAVDVVFIPVVNPDGHERFAPNNRPNQRGPAEMGFRTNGARLNINRDFVKAETPEMHALLRAITTYRPVLLIDLHTTDGAKFEHDISLNVAPLAPRNDQVGAAAKALSDALIKRMTELGHLPLDFYPSFVTDDDPTSGFKVNEPPPRFSQAYASARSRIGLLVETHSWRTYRERAESTYHTLQAVFEDAKRHAADWAAATTAADRADAALAGTPVTLVWNVTNAKTERAFRGYAYQKSKSELSGADWIVYDERTPQIWNVPMFTQLAPGLTVTAPRGGYIVDGGVAQAVAALLDRHGLRYVKLAPDLRVEVEAFRATKVTYRPPFEGRTAAVLEGAWAPETRALDRGAIFVPIAQPTARLLLHMFEPAAPDSLVQWGMFNTAFESKEYAEQYVSEQFARDLLAADPGLKAKFDAAVAADPELAKSPKLRLEWFYKRHASYDERLNLVPVYRTATTYPAAAAR